MFITTIVPNTLTLRQAWESGIWVKRIQMSNYSTLFEAKPNVGEAELTHLSSLTHLLLRNLLISHFCEFPVIPLVIDFFLHTTSQKRYVV